MSELVNYRYLWDGSAPEWVIAHLDRREFFPFNLQTGQGMAILDGEPGLMDNILRCMREAGRPLLNYKEWSVQRSTASDVLRSIEDLSRKVQKIRTHSTRELGTQALSITAPLAGVRAQLEVPHDEATLRQAARTVWSVQQGLLEFCRAHHL
ncbi:hypothetical protein [Deinococcus multiflagellatus]|uniref:Uncharacterized protein n=1 Tax=Deinococcus multiflagellatus TaxID=1656887 RepID=A0ABW1ZP90_9DEIO|nr:hypothetical protein [Deinococcus multiflagellatus]MBZ9712661.1 hypothetical protein [Deinococcus multiflagellatus]